MNEVIEKENIKIEDMIVEIRGVQVMLDSDLAKLYQCKNGTKEINQAVKNNLEKFPERYSWVLTDEEWLNLRSKILTSSMKEHHGGRRYPPRVFTEQGISMLSTILKTSVATEISIKIMDTFVLMRHYLINNKDVYKSLNSINTRLTNHETKLLEYDDKFNHLFSIFDKKENLFLQGEIYDAYSNFVNLFKQANNEIIVIDSYADITFLDLIRNLNFSVILITKNSDRLSDTEIAKYNCQYNNLKVIRDNSFHDRYFILDRKTIYHSGTSINNAGNKTFSINKLEDEILKKTLLKNVLSIIKK